MQEANGETILGDFSGSTFAHDGAETTFFRRDGSFMVRTEGEDGTERDYEIAYVFGVTPLQQYLIAQAGGRLQPLGLAWDTRTSDEGGQRWFHLFPDDGTRAGDPLHWTNRNQTWNHMCAACHSTNLTKNYDAESDSYETTWSEIDVSCEACHGPGSVHVAWATEDVNPDRSTDNGLTVHLGDSGTGRWLRSNTEYVARRTAPRAGNVEIETCAQCHSRRQRITNVFQPSDGFLNGHRVALLEPDLYYADGQIQEEVYVYGSFLQSAMYMNGVICSDCHDPHSLRTYETGNDLCTRCHASSAYDTSEHHFHPQDSRGAQCVECHMPGQTYMGVDRRRDHSLRIPRPDLSGSIGTPNACTQCHTNQSAAWAERAVRAWYGEDRDSHFGEVLHAARSGAPDTIDELVRLAADTEKPAIVRATALTLFVNYDNVDTREVLQRMLTESDGLIRFGAVRASEGLRPEDRYALLFQYLDDPVRAVRDEIGRVLAGIPETSMRESDRAMVDNAVAGYIASQLMNADRPEAHLNLSTVYVARRQIGAADSALQRALALDSTFVPAYVNLAELRRLQGRDFEGQVILTAALEQEPDNAFVHHALGLLLVRSGRAQNALPELERAAELAPENARFAYVYGVALHSLGQADRAAIVLEEASARHPADLDILRMLLSLDQERGDTVAAIGHVRKILEIAPDDPNAQELLRRLLATSN